MVIAFFFYPKPRKEVVLCPFHDEKTPSMFIGPGDRYFCISCGAKGKVQTGLHGRRIFVPEVEKNEAPPVVE
jgi:hypothetical protein